MRQWTTVLTVNETIGQIAIRCGIFLGGNLSSLLFVMCLAPLSVVFDRTFKGYQFSDSSTVINHLVYIDDIAAHSRKWNH